MADRTVLDLYRHDVESPRPEHYAHWTPAGRRVLSTEEFFSRTCSLAEAWFELGVSRGDRVVLLSDNRPEWHMVDLSLLDLGAVDVPVYQTLTPAQLAYQVEDSGAVAAVAELGLSCPREQLVELRPFDVEEITRFGDADPGGHGSTRSPTSSMAPVR